MDYVKIDKYYVKAVGNKLIIQPEDGEKRVFKVVPDRAWAYKIQKTQVNAQGGAEGLMKTLTDLAWSICTISVLQNIYTKVKQATGI